MRVVNQFASVLALLILMSCVTINIYFPEAAAEKAADRIIEDVWGEDAANTPATEPQSRTNQDLPVAMQLLNWLVPTAQAQIDININSPAACK